MSGQLESPHFFRVGDLVRFTDGLMGTIVDAATLYAIVVWDSGRHEEIDQFDPRIVVVERAELPG